MSTDRWSTYPICHNLPDQWRNGIDHLYGQLPQKNYLKVVAECKRLSEECTVREDYEIVLGDDGTVSIVYSGMCDNCGASWEFMKTGIQHKNVGGI